MTRTQYLSVAAVLALWALTIIAFLTPFSPPVEAFGKDYVIPHQVRAGQSVVVFRTFRVTRNEHIQISRTMVKGECKQYCDLVDLASGAVLLRVGEYVDIPREHRIPMAARPGVYTLVFVIHWQNRLGRWYSHRLPELTIEVVE